MCRVAKLPPACGCTQPRRSWLADLEDVAARTAAPIALRSTRADEPGGRRGVPRLVRTTRHTRRAAAVRLLPPRRASSPPTTGCSPQECPKRNTCAEVTVTWATATFPARDVSRVARAVTDEACTDFTVAVLGAWHHMFRVDPGPQRAPLVTAARRWVAHRLGETVNTAPLVSDIW